MGQGKVDDADSDLFGLKQSLCAFEKSSGLRGRAIEVDQAIGSTGS